MSNQWIGVAAIVVLLLAMLGGLKLLRARSSAHPEVLRKLAHVGLGLATLSFPWLFTDLWPVLLLCGMAVALLLSLRYVPPLRDRFGSVVHGVARSSRGDLYFPIAAAALFVLSEGSKILFTIPLLTLAFADATAAVIGVHYGRTHYTTSEGHKSLEGSIAFFTVAFLTTHIPLLLFTATGRAESLLIGLMFGMLVMLMEAVAWRGLDNLFIPFGGFLLLTAYLPMDARALATRLVATVLLLALVLVLRKHRTLSDTGVAAGVLIGYVAWSTGGWTWLVPPLVVFLSYTLLYPRARQLRERPHDIVTVFAVASSGLVWLLAASVERDERLYYPYTVAFAANLCFIGITWFRNERPALERAAAVGGSGVIAWALLFVPYLLILRDVRAQSAAVLLALLWIAASGVAYWQLVPHHPHEAAVPHPWLRQATIGFVASAFALASLLAIAR